MSHFSTRATSKYGASMGRSTSGEPLVGKVSLRKVKLDAGGYDEGGAYWGAPDYRHNVFSLYYAVDEEGNEHYFRARDRGAAKFRLLEKYPGVRFTR